MLIEQEEVAVAGHHDCLHDDLWNFTTQVTLLA